MCSRSSAVFPAPVEERGSAPLVADPRGVVLGFVAIVLTQSQKIFHALKLPFLSSRGFRKLVRIGRPNASRKDLFHVVQDHFCPDRRRILAWLCRAGR
ncbi:hypothetical protein RV134_290074 [Roseovarius sp. EC-HK134]|nr:hypothetical protein RV134_290074 [Roseovarius sp. EC-HK134]VVT18223.1 hypothetical protein RV420_360069 [Roseovarius sp. EC-SD190]